MNIAIIGFGKMGKMIKEDATQRGWTITSIIDPDSTDSNVTGKTLSDIPLSKTDVAIDFSSPSSALDNIRFYAESGLSAVIGTTGWYDRMDEIRKSIDLNTCSILYSGNFSLGVAILLKSAGYLSSLMNRISSYDVSIVETHHREKADSPSGTARMLASTVLEKIERKERVVYGNVEGKISHSDLQVSSIRLGSICGDHSLVFDSPADTIVLSHSARNRGGFSQGALSAASWIAGRKGFYSMDDYIDDFLKEDE